MRFFGILAFTAVVSVFAAPIVPLTTDEDGLGELSIDAAIVQALQAAGVVTPELCMSDTFLNHYWPKYSCQLRSPNARQ